MYFDLTSKNLHRLRNILKKIQAEGIEGVRKRDAFRVDAALREAGEQLLLDTAAYIRAYKAFVDKDFGAALQHLEEALRLDPTFAEAHHLKGTVLIEKGDYEAAIRSVDYSLQNLGLIHYAAFYNNKGVAFERLGHLDGAMFCFLQAIEDYEFYELAYQNLLLNANKRRAWLDSLVISGKIREKFGENSDLLNRVGTILLNQAEQALKEGKPDVAEKLVEEAGKQLQLAVGRDPENHSILYNLACFYSRSGKLSEALAALKKAFETTARDEEKMQLRRMAREDVDFTNIKEDPFFKELVTSSNCGTEFREANSGT